METHTEASGAGQRPTPPYTDPRATGRWLRTQLAAAEDDGYFGPGSTMWRLNREAVAGLGLGRALLMQVAHPWVAQAIADHSAFRERPLDRMIGTIIAAELLVFGSRAQADAAASRILSVHGGISGVLREDAGCWRAGTPYSAGDPEALLWVLVTLLDTSLRVHEAAFGRLPERVVRAYLAEGARLGALLGVPPGAVPGDRAALKRYIATMIANGAVVVGPTARRVAEALLHTRVVPGLSWRVYSAATHVVAATTLAAPLRAQYGPVLRMRYRLLYGAAGKAGRTLLPFLPDSLRLDPIAAVAIRRAAARAGYRRDRVP